MGSQNGDDQLSPKQEHAKKSKITYSRELLLSLSELEICSKLPSGLDSSILSEFEDSSSSLPERSRIPGSLSSQNIRRGEYGPSPPARGDSGSYSRGTHGWWDSRSSGSNDRETDSQLDSEPDGGRRYGNPWRSGQTLEHDGLLGSGSSQKPSGFASAPVTKVRGSDQYQLKKTYEPYQPPRPYKGKMLGRDKIHQQRQQSTNISNIESCFPPMTKEPPKETKSTMIAYTKPRSPQKPSISTPNKVPQQSNKFSLLIDTPPEQRTQPTSSTDTQRISLFQKSPTYKQIIKTEATDPSPKVITPSTFRAQTPQTDYLYKEQEQFICVLEPEIYQRTKSHHPYQLSELLLPPTHQYLPDNFGKNQIFYEKILTQTNSAKFQYMFDQSDLNKIRYCKVRIYRVLTMTDWGQDPITPKDLTTQPNTIQKYNYWDYVTAWRRAFLRQNHTFSLSFFLYFAKDFTYPTPFWFHKWWTTYGIDESCAPTEVISAHQQFFDKCKLPQFIEESPSWLIFCHNFQVPWIFMTEFHTKEEPRENFMLPILVRKFKLKWWPKTDITNCNITAVNNFFNNNPDFSKTNVQTGSSQPEQFLATKRQLMAKMACCTSQAQMDDILNQLRNSTSTTGSVTEADDDNDNDDFFTQEIDIT